LPANRKTGTEGCVMKIPLRQYFRRDLLYLQFRKGRWTGWKGDAGHDWVWQW
jgi:hypothetical protein